MPVTPAFARFDKARVRAPVETIQALLSVAGFGEVELFGWWDATPHSAANPEIIAIAQA